MKPKKIRLIFYSAFISMLVLAGFSCHDSAKIAVHDIQSRKVVIKVENYGVTAQEFKHRFNSYISPSDSGNKRATGKSLVELYVIEGLLRLAAQKQNLARNPEVKKKLLEIERETLIAAMKDDELNRQKMTDKELIACYERSKEMLRYNRVVVQKKYKNYIEKIVDYLKAGGVDFSKFSNFATYETKTIEDGIVRNKAEQHLYDMKIGEIKVQETAAGYEVVHLVDRRPYPRGLFEQEKENIRLQLAKAKLQESGDSVIDRVKSNSTMVIHPAVLAENLNLTIKLVTDESQANEGSTSTSNPIIARIADKTVSLRELQQQISDLPSNIQYYFRNRITRLKAVQALLMLNRGYQPKDLSRHHSYPWLYPEVAFDYTDEIAIHHTMLHEMNIPQPITYDDQHIVAKSGHWKLIDKTFIEKWQKLPADIKNEFLTLRIHNWDEYLLLQEKFISYLFDEEHPATQNLEKPVIDTNLLMNIDLPSDDACPQGHLSEADTAVSFGPISFTLEVLRGKIISLPVCKRREFDRAATREKAIEHLLIDELWLFEGRKNSLDTVKTIVQSINDKKQRFLVHLLLHNRDKSQFYERKLDRLIQDQVKLAGIYLDPEWFHNSGIIIDRDSIVANISVIGKMPEILSFIAERGSILREFWLQTPGSNPADLRYNTNYPLIPDYCDELSQFCSDNYWERKTGMRIRGYLYAPVSGAYLFWISGDVKCELWLSTDDQPDNVQLIASNPLWATTWEWLKYDSQQSNPIHLTAGQRYYIEAFYTEYLGLSSLTVGWQKPGADPEIIPGEYLSPVLPDLFDLKQAQVLAQNSIN